MPPRGNAAFLWELLPECDTLRPMKDAFLILLLLPAVMTGGVRAATSPDDQPEDGQEEFVLQLRQRGLSELAEQYCRDQQSLASDTDLKTHWEILATDCDQDHAWQLSGSQRTERISQSASQLTEFLRTHTPSAEFDLWLRIRQIELLNAAAQMECESRSVHQRTLRSAPGASSAAAPCAPSVQFALDACQQGRELGEALLKQLDLIRRDLDGDIVRTTRMRMRFALAELVLSESRLTRGTAQKSLQQNISDQAEQLLKSAGENDRFRARLLMAQIKLDQQDFAAFDLRQRSLAGEIRNTAERIDATALQMTSHLLQRKPSEAIRLTVAEPNITWQQSMKIQVLRLEALLQLCELLLELEDSTAERQQSLLRSASEFRQLHERLLLQARGVWLQRTQTCFQRFELVMKVGASGATALEEISLLIAAGDLKSARNALHSLADRRKSDSSLTAFVLLQSGDLAVRQSDWSGAIPDLARAMELFRELQNKEREASADLLRIFCLGQIWNSSSESQTAGTAYLEALNNHLRQFPDQPTAGSVLEYRARFYRPSAPLKAAGDVLSLLNQKTPGTADSDTSAGQDPEPSHTDVPKLCLLADLLMEDLLQQSSRDHSPSPGELAERTALFREFQNRAETCLHGRQQDHTSPELQTLRLFLLCETLITVPDSPTSAVWESIHSQSTVLLNQTSSITTDPAVASSVAAEQPATPFDPNSVSVLEERALMGAHASGLLASIKLLHPDSDRQSSLDFLQKQPASSQQLVSQLLQTHLADAGTPGSQQLAALITTLRTSSDGEPGNPAAQLAGLKRTLQLALISGQFQDVETSLNQLMNSPLSNEQLSQIADIVADARPAENSPSRMLAPRTLKDFWNKVLKQTRSGQPAWLEASLQLALLAHGAGEDSETRRILGVVEVLHPDWGDQNRKQRAEALKTLVGRPR